MLNQWNIAYRYAKTMRPDIGTLEDYVYTQMLDKQQYPSVDNDKREILSLFKEDGRLPMVKIMIECAQGYYFSVDFKGGFSFLPYATSEDIPLLLNSMNYSACNVQDFTKLLEWMEHNNYHTSQILYGMSQRIKNLTKEVVMAWVDACFINATTFKMARNLLCSDKQFVLDFEHIKSLNLPEEHWRDIVQWDVHLKGSAESVQLWEMERKPEWDMTTFERIHTLVQRKDNIDVSWHPYWSEYRLIIELVGSSWTFKDIETFFQTNKHEEINISL